ncbi:MAG: hypothetical protein M1836_000647 [Candelina mexicana]|nr:MAG: hypothetical protein M1836_000647 [Candelina mexicana]
MTSTPASSPILIRPSTIPHLRESAAAYFAKQNFERVVWLGVYGSFARNEQTEESEVNLVGVTTKAQGEGKSYETTYLGEELVNVWGRKVVVHYIQGNTLELLHDVTALLTSRTIFGSEEASHVIKLRNDAMDMVLNGQAMFSQLSSDIQSTRALAISGDFENFQHSVDLRTEIRDKIISIICRLLEMKSPLLSEFEFHGGEGLEDMKKDLDRKASKNGALESVDSEYWKTIWTIATSKHREEEHLAGMDSIIRIGVLPSLAELQREIEKVRELAKTDAPGEETIHNPNEPK